MQLTEYLQRLSEIWATAHGRTLGALATQVANDGKFFTRLDAGMQPRVATFEKFLAFFRSGENWPDNRIPLSAAELLDRLENIAVNEEAATGQADDVSPQQADAA